MFENPTSAPACIVLKELLGDKKASKEQQMRVLEHRREILARCMKSFSQKTLGQLACLDSGDGFYHELQEDKPRVLSIDSKFTLNTRGFFAGNNLCKKNEQYCITFGVDSDSWLLIEAHFYADALPSGGKYEKAYSVQVSRISLEAILETVGIEPSHIWMYFRMITEEWVSSRKNLYDDASKVAQGMKEEDCIFRMIA